MTSTVPGVIAWPVIVSMVVLLGARYWLCRTNLYDTYFNGLMGFIVAAQLLREGSIEDVLSAYSLMTVTTAQQLGFVAMVFASCELIGFTMLWTGLSVEETRRQHRYYRVLAVVSCVCFLAAATRARTAGQTLEVSGGWDAVAAWSFYLVVLLVMAARFTRMFAGERKKARSGRESLLATGGLILGVMTASGCLEALVFAVTDEFGWTSTVRFRLWLHGFEFFCIAVFVFVMGAVPLVVALLSRFGLDSTSRKYKGLRPLRLAMTTVIPEVSFNPSRGDSHLRITTVQLHQTVIEIRDSILRLRRYFGDIDLVHGAGFLSDCSVPVREHSAAIEAFYLAHAARSKVAGVAPRRPDVAPVLTSRSTTLDEEVAELLKVAKWWGVAWAATEYRNAPGPTAIGECA